MPDPACPRCRSKRIATGFPEGSTPGPLGRRLIVPFRCRDCGHDWQKVKNISAVGETEESEARVT